MLNQHIARTAGRSCRRLFAAALVAAIAAAIPGVPRAELRPLTRAMLENLGSVNEIGEAIALEDYEQVEHAANELAARARALKGTDLSKLGIDPQRDPEFDAFLTVQEKTAQAIGRAAGEEDGAGAFLGLQSLLSGACLSCHRQFREPLQMMRPSVSLMTSMLQSWREINRGLSINDFDLVARRAREIESVGRVFTWDQIISTTFGVEDPEERKQFRKLLRNVLSRAAQIGVAADSEDAGGVVEATQRMWIEGCVSCHAEFR